MSADQACYEIYAVAKKNWRLLSCVPTSGEAIEEATKLQHTEKYSAIQVIVRPTTEGVKTVSPRLLYQFTRPGARLLESDPLMESTKVSAAAQAETPDAATAIQRSSHRSWIIAGCWIAVMTIVLAFVFSD